MPSNEVQYRKRGHSAWITLNRPEVLNAVTPEMIGTLGEVLARARDDDDVRVLVVTGTGRGFCPGFDIKLFRDMDLDATWRLADRMIAVWTAVRTFPKPTIAALNGVTAGGGFELALCCDLRIAASNARIGSCEVRINQPTTNGSSYLLARLIGESKARELCLTGDIWSADEAERFGLVNAIAEPEEFEQTVQNWADRIASRAPIAVRAVKGFFERGRTMSADQAVQMEEKAAIDCTLTSDQREAFTAFLEKREPEWSNS